MHKRINITLPPETLRLIDHVAAKGDRSRLIDEAIKHYLMKLGRRNLREQLKKGARRRLERDRQLAQEWFGLEETAWPRTNRK